MEFSKSIPEVDFYLDYNSFLDLFYFWGYIFGNKWFNTVRIIANCRSQ